ncbi:MAG: lipid-A-disaccharide synthase [Acidobacteria bacterium]|nr:lipid-A-disaccharide synthase [Acidobacteriota bacterium]
MSSGRVKIMLVAGEASGDKHGANLAAALRAARPDLDFEIFGSGGDEMRSRGVETLVDSREVAIMGALEVARALPKFLRVFRRLREAARKRRPDLVVLIDWPEFNLRLAKRLSRDGHRIVYYISPQIWAWRGYRINTIKRYIEKMLVILPFEEEYYRKNGVKVDYVGHPLLDSVRVTTSKNQFCARYGIDKEKPLVALLPGSRHSEIKYILPAMMDAVRILNQNRSDVEFIIPLASTFNKSEIEAHIAGLHNLSVIENDTCNAVASADLAVVASGTATLETAIIGTPLIVAYRASQLNWRIFRPLINVEFVGMPNLIAGKEIVPELLQDDLNGPGLAAEITGLLDDKERLARMRSELSVVRERIGESRASDRAAQIICEML